jgi:hypothetical protein
MDADTWIEVAAPFYTAVGEVVKELTRRNIADIDLELLKLKREELTDRLNETRTKVAKAADLEKKNAVADLSSRGLGGSSLKESTIGGVDSRSAEVLDKMHREYNRAIEKIALMERKVSSRRWWHWLFGK